MSHARHEYACKRIGLISGGRVVHAQSHGTGFFLHRLCSPHKFVVRLGNLCDARLCEQVFVVIHDDRMHVERNRIKLAVEAARVQRSGNEIVHRSVDLFHHIVERVERTALDEGQHTVAVHDDDIGCFFACKRRRQLRIIIGVLCGIAFKPDILVRAVEFGDHLVEEFSVTSGKQRPKRQHDGLFRGVHGRYAERRSGSDTKNGK